MLSDKHIRFCEEYLIDFNGAQAAIRAGYAKKSARVQASTLLTNPNIQAYLQKLKEISAKKLEISRDRVLAEYVKIGFSDIRKLFDKNSRLIPLKDLDDDSAAAIASVEVDQLWGMTRDGKEQIGDTKKVKLWDKKAALDSICKIMGYNAPDKVLTEVHLNDEVVFE